MKISMLLLLVLICIKLNAQNLNEQQVKFYPVVHATMVIEYGNLTIFIDPAADIEKLRSFSPPDLILITHTHGDHLNPEMIEQIKSEETLIVGNKAAINQLGNGIYLMNHEKKFVRGIEVEAVPMYNITENRLHYHPKGDGNGYIITLGNERIYISGDTENTKEVLALKDIDHAFLSINLPFTMTPEQAASAVIKFQPKKVYPYHYSQGQGFADLEKFKTLVNESCSTEVVLLDWYPKKN
jgi:L-ascorbate metabolism protein UlaG (beta-lactamase superfamily)